MNSAMDIVPTGVEHDFDPVIGTRSRDYACRSVSGRKRRMDMYKVMKTMLNREIYWFQSVNTRGGFPGPPTWRSGGLYNMRYSQLPVSANFVMQIDLPIYVFRLNVPCGTQMNAGVASVDSQPVVAYRLRAFQVTASANFYYRWIAAPPNNNGTTLANLNVPKKIVTEGRSLAATEIFQEYAKCEVLLTGAGLTSSDVNIQIVKFNNDYSAPPDQYYQSDSTTLVTYSKNSGTDQAPGGTASPDLDDDLKNSRYYNTWLARVRGHPVANSILPPGTPGRFPFTSLKKCRCSLLSRSTETASLMNNQLKMTHTENYYKWHNTNAQGSGILQAQPNLGPDVAYEGWTAIDLTKHVGIFPDSTVQRWLMVSSFSRLNNALEQGIDPNWDVTFDLRIQSAFSAPIQPVPTV